jgi:uncharacterized damage-inducible protein DinB
MKAVMTALTIYNQGADRALCETIAKADEELLKSDCGTYYHSVLSTMQHYLSYEIAWLQRYRTFDTYRALDNSFLDQQLDDILAKTKHSFIKTQSVLLTIDALFADLVSEMTDDDLHRMVKFTNPRGMEVEKKYWSTIFHVLNHSTHHRGEISAMLDILQISNDYAGFFRYV